MLRFSPRDNRAALVRWREWGEAAFEEARAADKPIVLVITAFWCGFCQRLDETTLSTDEVITLLNALFVPVRVEESQRPDVDVRYNVQGAWPAIVFLTPAAEHLLTCNYTPPEQFIDLLVRVADAYQGNREALLAGVRGVRDAAATEAGDEGSPPLSRSVVEEVAGMLEGLADAEHGGFGEKPKFLHTEALEFLLYLYETSRSRWHLEHVLFTLGKLRASPTYDARDGGFYRYSTRGDWREPHPEKLLDDQAALLRVYLHAYLLTDEPALRRTAEELIDYLMGVLSPEGQPPFAGCQDYVMPGRPSGESRPPGPLQRLSVLDELVYCDANARAASACLDAYWLLGREDCRDRAVALLDWLWQHLGTVDGSMRHYWDASAHVPGLLLDAVRMGCACLDAYAVFEESVYLERARLLAQGVLDRHRGPEGALFDIAERGPAALSRPLTVLTQNAAAAQFLIRLGALSGEARFLEDARAMLQAFPNRHRHHGAYAAGFGEAVARLLSPAQVVLLAGAPGPGARAEARAVLLGANAGNLVLRRARSV